MILVTNTLPLWWENDKRVDLRATVLMSAGSTR